MRAGYGRPPSWATSIKRLNAHPFDGHTGPPSVISAGLLSALAAARLDLDAFLGCLRFLGMRGRYQPAMTLAIPVQL